MAADDQRYQVFVSSTYLDLREERHAIIMALLQLNAIPAGMELFPAADEDAWTLIKSVIDDCDYYLLVVGGKYGSVDPVEDISYTEREYDYAVAQRKPVMAFLHGDPDAIPVGRAEKSEEAQKKLAAFRTKVERRKHVKYWTSPEDLAGKVALSFALFTKSYPAPGWIRGDKQASSEVLAELNELRKNLSEMQLALDEARTSPPTGSEELAQGSDKFEIWLTFSMYLSKPSVGRIKDTVDIDPSWDRIFAVLGPLMLDESAEEALGEHIDDWAGVEYWPEVQRPVSKAITAHGSKADTFTYSNYNAEISNEDFHTILVQLVALGLITKSDRKRSVADKSTYWTLTPYGRTRLIQLRAIRREGGSAHVNESVQDLTETTKAVDKQQTSSPETPAQSSGNRKDRSVTDST